MRRRLTVALALAVVVAVVAGVSAEAAETKRHVVRGQGISLVLPSLVAGARRPRRTDARPRSSASRRDNPELAPYLRQLEQPSSPLKFFGFDPVIRNGFATNVNVIVVSIGTRLTFADYRRRHRRGGWQAPAVHGSRLLGRHDRRREGSAPPVPDQARRQHLEDAAVRLPARHQELRRHVHDRPAASGPVSVDLRLVGGVDPLPVALRTRFSPRRSRTRGTSRAREGARGTRGSGTRARPRDAGTSPTTSTSHIGSGARRRPDGAEAAAAGLRLLEQVEVDLDVVHLLQAPDVGMTPGLVRVHERARHTDARAGVDDLLAVDVAAAARDLVLCPERERDRGYVVSSTTRLCSSRGLRRKT